MVCSDIDVAALRPLPRATQDIIDFELREGLGKAQFNSWLAEASFMCDPAHSERVYVFLKLKFAVEYVQTNFHTDLSGALQRALGRSVEIEVDHLPGGMPLRRVSDLDNQFDLFVPVIAEIPIKDDVHLMEFAPFTLQPRGDRRTRMTFTQIDGMDIDIHCHPQSGLPTDTDYDLVLLMHSWLAAETNHYRKALDRYRHDLAQGRAVEAPTPPARSFRPTIAQIMQFTRNYDKELGKRHGSKQAALLEERLDRLKRAEIKLRQSSGRKRRVGTFSYIQDWRVVSETTTGNILEVEIDIPNWIYQGIVESVRPTIRTYHRDYHLIRQPLMKFLYRFLRLHAVDQEKTFELEELYRRSGSRQSIKEFNRSLALRIKQTQGGGFFDWHLEIGGSARRRELIVRLKEPVAPRLL